ncbi:zinc ribbon domain-containing protein [Candidatus Methylacidiphilum fumarolicum]|jgi:transposase|uniref:Transposase n=2 Tax=Candidatus Methylacidiphilum fumarolicum TaxID=591154 RepID=A0ABN8XG78_9BACT|nr:zinc ribbon domain-containing protein [Candidatus Methylacidiphilum fumarolicum]CAI9084702.1 protein of unknown function [Candidatus Methylacidiphilum fumarolicum]
MYQNFEKKGRQYIPLMILEGGKRIVIPLSANSKIQGMICLVLKEKKATIPYAALLKVPKRLYGEAVGINARLSEFFTDDHGKKYGRGFGELLANLSKFHKEKGKKRQNLQVIDKNPGKAAKARRIRKHNLEKKKRLPRLCKAWVEIERRIHTSLQQLFKLRIPSVIASESLVFRLNVPSKDLSRRIIQLRSYVLPERIELLAPVGGSRREKVYPACSSELCPRCGYVHSKNRSGDKFMCRHRGDASYAESVGAYHLKKRIGDREIFSWRPQNRLHAMLLERFARNSGLPPDWNPEEGDCTGMDDSRQREDVLFDCQDDRLILSRFSEERNGHGDTRASQFKTMAKKNGLGSSVSKSQACF